MSFMRSGQNSDRFARSADEGFRALLAEIDDPPEHAAVPVSDPGAIKFRSQCTCGDTGRWYYAEFDPHAKARAQGEAERHVRDESMRALAVATPDAKHAAIVIAKPPGEQFYAACKCGYAGTLHFGISHDDPGGYGNAVRAKEAARADVEQHMRDEGGGDGR